MAQNTLDYYNWIRRGRSVQTVRRRLFV